MSSYLTATTQKKYINNIEIDATTIPITGARRSLNISGDDGAIVKIQIHDESEPVKFYNFITETFEVGANSSENTMTKELQSNFSINISFPAGGSTSYRLFVFAHDPNTEMGEFVSLDKFMFSETISQVSVLSTLSLSVGTADTGFYETLPAAETHIGDPFADVTESVEFEAKIENINSGSTKCFGLVRNPGFLVDTTTTARTSESQINQAADHWYYQVLLTVDGAITSGSSCVVNSLGTADTLVGASIVSVDGGSLSGTPQITSVDVTEKRITFDTAQTFSDDRVLTVRAYGPYLINQVTGSNIEFDTIGRYLEDLIIREVRGAVSGTTVNLNGANGITAGSTVTGTNWNNESANAVQTVAEGALHATRSSGAGSVVVQVSQTLKDGNLLTFTGSVREATVSSALTIRKYPTVSQALYLDLDKFILQGNDGS